MSVSAWADSCSTEGRARSRMPCSPVRVCGRGADTEVGESRAEHGDEGMAIGETTTADASTNHPHGLSTISAAVSKLVVPVDGSVSKRSAAHRPASSRRRNNPQEAPPSPVALPHALLQRVARALRKVQPRDEGEHSGRGGSCECASEAPWQAAGGESSASARRRRSAIRDRANARCASHTSFLVERPLWGQISARVVHKTSVSAHPWD